MGDQQMRWIDAPTEAAHRVSLDFSQKFTTFQVPQLHQAFGVGRGKDFVGFAELHECDWVVVEERSAFSLEFQSRMVGIVNGVIDLDEAVHSAKS